MILLKKGRLAGCWLICLALASGSQSTGGQKPADVHFVSPDGIFAFTYPSSLIKCEKDPKQEGRWIPNRSCEAVIPVCTYASLSKDATVACIAYPAETLSGTNFEAAAFTVNKLDEATADECAQVTEPHPATSHKEKVNGVTFDVFDVGGVAAGSLSAADAYRSFHQNNCYELDVRVAFVSMGAVDPGTLKGFDYDKVHHTLQSVLNTFKFLK